MISDTSMEAYYSIVTCSAPRCRCIRSYIEANPNVTNEDVSRALGIRIQGVTPRTRELMVNGLLWVTGRARTSSGRNAKTFCAPACPKCLSTHLQAERIDSVRIGYYCWNCGKRFSARTGETCSDIVEVCQ